ADHAPGRPLPRARRRSRHVLQSGGGKCGLERTRGPQSGAARVPWPRDGDATTGDTDERAGDLAEPDAMGAVSKHGAGVHFRLNEMPSKKASALVPVFWELIEMDTAPTSSLGASP